MWLEALEHVLERTGVEVAASAGRPADALAAVKRHRPDLFVTEIQTGDASVDGFECVRRAQSEAPALRTIVLSMHDDTASIDGAFAAGAAAYVVKTAHPDDLAAAIRQTFDPSIFLARDALRTSTPAAALELTPRELEVLRLVAAGDANAVVARKLWVTEQTVKFHLSNVYRKLGVTNRTEASHWAHQHGLVEPRVA